jgi:nucleotide-binding universal stress UspA family protein
MSGSAGFRKILVAFDGSTDSARAVRVASSLSLKYGASLLIVHVYHASTVMAAGGPNMPVPDFSELRAAARDAGMETLTRGVEAASKEGVKARGELLDGSSAVEAIVTFAAAEKADLIVMGTRGMTGFKKLIMGSVSSGVVNHADCPVLVVR